MCEGAQRLTRRTHRDRLVAWLGQGMWEQEPDRPAGAQAQTRSFLGNGSAQDAVDVLLVWVA